ncbi:PITH domain-containing protein [Tribonema minus]|uniref:PITH domain-containing protein n=1 Tax=Tribonema minus TaxID=303371 RepID=A0A835Z9A2_9STRA|nr:PITH domain-containing protein [Tribonema minus]
MASAARGVPANAAAAAPAAEFEVRDLNDLISKAECFCLNEKPSATWRNLFMGDDRLLLTSDADEQLLLHIGFNETVKLHSINFQALNDDSAPATVKLFINRDSMGFSDCEDIEATQTLELTAEDLKPDSATLLKFVKFQRVSSISIFVEENNGAESTSLSSIKFFGAPVATTKMSEFKKQEEGH